MGEKCNSDELKEKLRYFVNTPELQRYLDDQNKQEAALCISRTTKHEVNKQLPAIEATLLKCYDLPETEIAIVDMTDKPEGIIVQYEKPRVLHLNSEEEQNVLNAIKQMPSFKRVEIRHGLVVNTPLYDCEVDDFAELHDDLKEAAGIMMDHPEEDIVLVLRQRKDYVNAAYVLLDPSEDTKEQVKSMNITQEIKNKLMENEAIAEKLPSQQMDPVGITLQGVSAAD